jgi:hypothetical protein
MNQNAYSLTYEKNINEHRDQREQGDKEGNYVRANLAWPDYRGQAAPTAIKSGCALKQEPVLWESSCRGRSAPTHSQPGRSSSTQHPRE